jgi:hypothetical protein
LPPQPSGFSCPPTSFRSRGKELPGRPALARSITRGAIREPHEVFAPDDATVEHLLDRNPWAYSVLGKVVDAFNATLDRYPLISLGTPDPYKPPR